MYKEANMSVSKAKQILHIKIQNQSSRIASSHSSSRNDKKIHNMTHRTNKNGFIAITSLLLISAITFTIAISISLLGIEETKTALAHKKGIESFILGQTCIEESLLRLRDNENYAGTTLNMENGSCTINISGSDPDFVIVAEANLEGPPRYTKKIEARVKKLENSINLISWREI